MAYTIGGTIVSIVTEIKKMEKKIEELTKSRKEWMDKHKALEQRFETVVNSQISPDVVKQLEVDNSKLIVEVSEHKRAFRTLSKEHRELLAKHRKAEAQLHKIREVLK